MKIYFITISSVVFIALSKTNTTKFSIISNFSLEMNANH